jgi:hypothetical protein
LALLAATAISLGVSRAADATSVNLRWAGAAGSAVTGLGTSTVTVAGAATLTLDIRIAVDSSGLSAAFLSLEFDRDLRNELNVLSFEEISWTGVMMTAMDTPSMSPLSSGLLTTQESSGSATGLLYTFDLTTVSTASDCCPKSTTLAFGRVVFATNPSSLTRDGGDIFAWVFNTGVDSIFNQAGGDILLTTFANANSSFATVNAVGGPPAPLKGLYADFDGNARSDILVFNNTPGAPDMPDERILYVFLMNFTVNGTTPLTTSTNIATQLPSGWSVVGIADVSGDQQADIFLFNSTNRQTYVYKMRGGTILDTQNGPAIPVGWEIVGVGDFNGDQLCDLMVLETSTGATYQFHLDFRQSTVQVLGSSNVGPAIGFSGPETIVGIADFDNVDHNGGASGGFTDDFLTVDGSGLTRQYYLDLDGGPELPTSGAGPTIASGSSVRAVGDFNNDGMGDMLTVDNTTGAGFIFLLNGLAQLPASGAFNRAAFLPAGWTVGTVGDYDNDGNTDVVVHNAASRLLYMYRMVGTAAQPNSGLVTTLPAATWIVPVSGPVDL